VQKKHITEEEKKPRKALDKKEKRKLYVLIDDNEQKRQKKYRSYKNLRILKTKCMCNQLYRYIFEPR
jgi:hypothetical protein